MLTACSRVADCLYVRSVLNCKPDLPAALRSVQAEFAARIQLIEDSEQFFPRTYQLPDERKQLIEYDADRKPEGWVRTRTPLAFFLWIVLLSCLPCWRVLCL